MEPMWSILLGWPVLGTVVIIAFGTGIGLLSMTPPHFTLAQVLFSIAAGLLGGRVAWWLAFESPRGGTLAFNILVCPNFGQHWGSTCAIAPLDGWPSA